MPSHNFVQPEGRIETVSIASSALSANLLGDPDTRDVAVYLPPGYDADGQDYSLFVDIVGYTGSGLSHAGWKLFGESVPQRVDRLVREGKMGPVIVALPDCFTSLGGNQYINSRALGNWADFLLEDMIPTLESRYRIKTNPATRALFGKSSGGYGAIAHGLRYGQSWGAIACHSGDMFFDWVYRNDLPATVMEIAGKGGSVGSWLEYFEGVRKPSGKDISTLMILAMAATYDPDPTAPMGVRLPLTLDTCEMDADRWAAWLEHDPIVMIDQLEHQQSLRQLKGIFIDCGTQDQYFLAYGARILSRKLEALGIAHEYQEFDDNHSSVDYRMDVSLPYLYAAVS